MKFCVMMTAQGNAVIGVKNHARKERGRKNVMSGQVFRAATATARAVTFQHVFSPTLTRRDVAKGLLRTAVNIVRISFGKE